MVNYQKFTVNEKTKLIKFFEEKLSELSYGEIMKILRQKDVKINGKRTSENVMLARGDLVEVYYQLKEKKTNYEIVYEDNNIVVIFKPSGILTTGKNSLEEEIQKVNKNYKAEHRLDRNTMGIVIFSKNNEVSELIHKAMKEGQIEKTYLAWVYGNLNRGIEDTAYLFKDAKKSLSIISKTKTNGASLIKTAITPIKHKNGLTLVSVKIHNGKTHQIRAHLAFLGYALVGDSKYAKREDLKKTKSKNQELLAYKLTFKIAKDNELKYLNNCKIEYNIDKFCNIF